MGAHITGSIAKFMGNQNPQGAIAVIGDTDTIGDAIKAIAVVALLTGINHLTEHGSAFRSHQEGLRWEGGSPHLAGQGEGQCVGRSTQINFIHMLEAREASGAIAFHHQKHATGGVEGDIADLVLADATTEKV